MKMKKALSGILSVTLVASLFAGCSGGASSSTSSSSAASTTSNSSAAAKRYDGTTINFIYPGAVWCDTVKANLDEFKTKTGITVNMQQFTNDQLAQKIAVAAAAGGKDIDVLCYAPLQNAKLYVKNGWADPLDTYLSKTADFDVKDFQEAAIQSVTVNGKIMGIPFLTEREVVSYNKKMFKDKGVSIPTTFDELMAAAEKLNDPAKGIAGITMRGKGAAAVTQLSGFLYGYGGDFITDGKASVNTDAAVKAFQFYGDILRKYGPKGSINMDWGDTQSLFAQGRAAMRVDADSQYAFSINPKNSTVAADVGVFQFPAGPSGSKPFNISAWCLGISSGSQNKDAAWEFIKWTTGKDMDVKAMVAGNPSARQSTWKNETATKAFNAELVTVINKTIPTAVGHDRPTMINVGDARTQIGNVIIGAIQGSDVKSLADKANAGVQKLLDSEAK
jgi:multiple sugar transport system substrate-binding protein